MIDKAVDRWFDLYDLLWKPLFWLLVIIDVIWFILSFTNNLIIFFSFFVFLWLQIILSMILDKKSKRKTIVSFLPDKPEKDGIRYLRGKRAKEYDTAWEKTDTYVEVGGIKKFFYGIRYHFYNLTGLRMNYWIKRPWYDGRSRRALDMLSIHVYEHPDETDPPKVNTLFETIRYKQLKHKYRKDLNRKEYWKRVWGKTNRPLFVWHEDIDLYKKLYVKKRKNKR